MGRRSVVFDTVLTAVVLAAGQAEAWTGAQATHRQGPHWAQALGYGLAAVALLIRRVRPLRCVLLVCGVLVLEFAVFGSPEGMALAVIPTVAAYTVANREDRTRALYGLAALAALGVAWLAFDPLTVTPVQYVQGSVWLSIWLIAWLLGAYLRTRRLYAAGLVRERRERELTAVAEERNRIARELHDVVGHSVSVMTVQASAVRRLMRPDQTKERAALETVEAAGREALTEMRRMVGVLRSGDAAPNLAPPPTLDQLGSLADDFRRAGLDVVVESDGEPVPLPPGLDLTAYRLVQEALTNTLRHAEATRVAVCVRYGKDALLIAVRDDGRGPNGSPAGTGLLGMRERVAVYGGSLSTGAAEGGGFELRAELPLEGT
ncbi:MAG: sensor histidine kinase [Blastococcus sp.]|jgi:signal transduction histidine kinase|nr:sensor histidine kinase [Blastococcus sp.]